MPEADGSLRAAPVAPAQGGPPGPEEGDGLGVAPATASVTQLKGMAPEPDLPISPEAMDEAIARTVAGRPG